MSAPWFLGLALAGAMGALVRWSICLYLARSPKLPLLGDPGVALSNALGALLLGALLGSGLLATLPGMAVGAGFCGALTTWSTPCVTAVDNAQSPLHLAPIASIAAHIGLALLSIAPGMALGRVLPL